MPLKLLIKKIMIWLMWYPLRWLINVLPRSIVYASGVAGGTLLYYISKDKQILLHKEFSLIFPHKPDKEIHKLIKASVVNFVLSELEVLFYPSMDKAFIDKMIQIDGKHHLDHALAQGSGVLLFQAHFGAFQIVMPAIGYKGYTMNQISAPATVWKSDGQPKLQQKSYDIKARHEYLLPVKHINVQKNLKAVFTALKRNEIVGITADGGGGGTKITTFPFLGRKANFQKGGVDIAVRTGAAMIPVFILTLQNFKHSLIIHPPIELNTTLPREEQIYEALKEYINILEDYVQQYPAHYGFNLFLRRSRVDQDPYTFFQDYLETDGTDSQ